MTTRDQELGIQTILAPAKNNDAATQRIDRNVFEILIKGVDKKNDRK